VLTFFMRGKTIHYVVSQIIPTPLNARGPLSTCIRCPRWPRICPLPPTLVVYKVSFATFSSFVTKWGGSPFSCSDSSDLTWRRMSIKNSVMLAARLLGNGGSALRYDSFNKYKWADKLVSNNTAANVNRRQDMSMVPSVREDYWMSRRVNSWY